MHSQPRMNLFGLDLTQLSTLGVELGGPRYLGRQLAGWIYKQDATSFADMTNVSAAMRSLLVERCAITRHVPTETAVSVDGTQKHLFAVPGRTGRFVEAASIPDPPRHTLCLSTQVGCKMGCLFCMTARQGFQQHLDAGQVVNQYASLPEREAVTNIVYMGMGEPLDNVDAVLRSIDIFTADWGYGISPWRITVSTVGLLPAINQLLDTTTVRLALSVHTPFDEERKTLMPVELVHPLKDVVRVLKERREGAARRISIEYIVFDGFNNTKAHAKELARLLNGLSARVNLIRFHEIPGSPLRTADDAKMEEFQDTLKKKGLQTTIRKSRGQDIYAACGLLSTKALVAAGEAADRAAGDSTAEKDW